MTSPSAERLRWSAPGSDPELIAGVVSVFLSGWAHAPQVEVAPIDPALSDTAAFCDRYGVPMAASANCVVVAGKREGVSRYAACVVLATDRADVNGIVRRLLDVRKASFAAMDDAVTRTAMEYGAITPLGLPMDWPIFIAAEVAAAGQVVVGSGVRRSKLRLDGGLLAELPGAAVIDGLSRH